MSLSSRAALAVLCISYALGSGGMIATKFAYESFTYGQVVFARVGIAAIFFLLMLPKWKNLPYRKGDWKYLGAVVLSEPCLSYLFMALGMKYTTATQGAVIYACFPMLAAVMAWIVLHEKLTSRTLVGIVLSIAGVVGMCLVGASSSESASNPILGNFFILCADIAIAAYAVSVRSIARRYSPMSIAAIQAIGGSAAFFPLLLTSGHLPQHVTGHAILAVLYMGIAMGVVSYMCFNIALQHIEAGLAALVGNLMPVFTLVYAYLLLGERMSLAQMFFTVVVIAGVFIATTRKTEKEESAAN